MSREPTLGNRMLGRRSGYTLVEVLLAAGLLVLVIAGAAAMALTIVAQEEMNVRIARVQNHQEQLARLYRLGLDNATIAAIVPPEPALAGAPDWQFSDVVIDGVGTVERAVLTIEYRPNEADPHTTRSRVVEVYRPSIR